MASNMAASDFIILGVNEAAPAPIIASGNGILSISTWLDAEDLEMQIVLSNPVQMTHIGHI